MFSAHITEGNFVLVKQFKFDSIRQESYWSVVNKLCKQCKSKSLAEAYKIRILNKASVAE